MVFVSRKIVYPVFLVIFAIAFFTLVYFVSFSPQVLVENTSVDFVGDGIVLKAEINNISNHYVRDAEIVVAMAGEEITAKLDPLAPKEVFNVVMPLPVSKDLRYDVFVNIPFRKSLHLPFELNESTVKPVNATVQLTSSMVVGATYDYTVKLCNVSENSLSEVSWNEHVRGNYFEESLFPRTISLPKNECKNLYSTLTPIKSGQVKIDFTLGVGGIEQNSSHTVNIVGGN
ncbi:MAG: hypothetical protein HOE11_01390 [Candidatus Diapherotrites archaeon]|jgi:hypothetical protein|nr:hypothetical protein [Candidatus Diapherotrites archaeon]MBT4596373.1 hypothetical protein [Candidatus Diapherotrites archaeon]